MSRSLPRIVPACLLLAVSLIWMTPRISAQVTGQPSTSKGEWPHHTGDVKGTRYSPLDQINASNFNKLDVVWRYKTDNLGPFPEFKLEGTQAFTEYSVDSQLVIGVTRQTQM